MLSISRIICYIDGLQYADFDPLTPSVNGYLQDFLVVEKYAKRVLYDIFFKHLSRWPAASIIHFVQLLRCRPTPPDKITFEEIEQLLNHHDREVVDETLQLIEHGYVEGVSLYPPAKLEKIGFANQDLIDYAKEVIQSGLAICTLGPYTRLAPWLDTVKKQVDSDDTYMLNPWYKELLHHGYCLTDDYKAIDEELLRQWLQDEKAIVSVSDLNRENGEYKITLRLYRLDNLLQETEDFTITPIDQCKGYYGSTYPLYVVSEQPLRHLEFMQIFSGILREFMIHLPLHKFSFTK